MMKIIQFIKSYIVSSSYIILYPMLYNPLCHLLCFFYSTYCNPLSIFENIIVIIKDFYFNFLHYQVQYLLACTSFIFFFFFFLVVPKYTDVCTERGTGLARRVQKKKKKDYTTPLDFYTIASNSIKKRNFDKK